MSQFKKNQDSDVIDDGWTIRNKDDEVIAHLDTEYMTDILMSVLIGDTTIENVKNYETNQFYGEEEDQFYGKE